MGEKGGEWDFILKIEFQRIPKILLHLISSPSCHQPRHTPTLDNGSARSPQPPGFASREHIWHCGTPRSFFLTPRHHILLTVFAFLITPYLFPFENWSPVTHSCWNGALLGAIPVHSSSHTPVYPKRPLLLPCLKYQLVTSKSFSPAQMSPSNSHTYIPCLPCLYKPQIPKFQYVPNRAHRLSPSSIPLARSLL